NFIPEIRAPKNRPAIGWLSKSFCIVQKRIRSPRKGYAVYISIHAHERHFAEAFGELQIRRKLRKVERRSQACRADHCGDVTRGGGDIVFARAAATKFGDQFIAR